MDRVLQTRTMLAVVGTSVGAGVLFFYLVVSPFAMVFFHLSHAEVDASMLADMHTSTWGAVVHAFSPEIPSWSTAFIGLGGLVGMLVGVVAASFLRKESVIRRHAARLAEAKEKLEEAVDRVLRADRLATAGLLSGGVLHDVNHYLQNAILIVDEQLTKLPADEREGSGWKEMDSEIQRVVGLAGSIREIQNHASSARSELDVHDVLMEAKVLLGRSMDRAELRRVFGLKANSSTVFASRGELLRVFVNLIQNAVDAVDGPGRIEVATRAEMRWIEVSVSDDGVGVSDKHLPHLFDPFFSTKAVGQGTGLGLAVCKQIVEQHGGTINARRDEEGGTIFEVRLPLADDLRRATDPGAALRAEAPRAPQTAAAG